jgi:hypothetical protein
MTYRPPLVLKNGLITQLVGTDTIENQVNTTFTYNAGKLVSVNQSDGYMLLTYSAGKLSTVYNSRDGKTATLTYTGGNLTSINIS